MANSVCIKDVLAEVESEVNKRKLPALLQREFLPLEDGASADGPVVRVMQWNALAAALSMGPDNFILCPNEALVWENRKWRVLEEMLRYQPDIVCLQEIDHFEYLQEKMMKAGYLGLFYPKPDSPCLYSSESNGPDGCVIFYNSKKISLVESHSIVLKEESGIDSNQVAIICKMQVKVDGDDLGKELCVAVTHLKAKQGYENLRRQQGKHLLKFISEKYRGIPMVITGDLNAAPNEPVYKVFKESDLDLTSAYCLLSEKCEGQNYTTWKIRGGFGGMHKETCKVEDYVWYTRKSLSMKSILKIPTGEEMGEKRLPSIQYPSDHISLVCDIVVK